MCFRNQWVLYSPWYVLTRSVFHPQGQDPVIEGCLQVYDIHDKNSFNDALKQ